MDLIEAVRNRRSIRDFKPDPVPKKVLQEILDVSRWTPSGGNVQPWHFAVLGGKTLEELKTRLLAKVNTWDGNAYKDTKPDLPRTGPYSQFLAGRQQSFRAITDAIRYPPGTKDLPAAQLEHREKLLRFFDAPNAIIICTDDRGPSSIISIGAVVQTICLTALTRKLGTCIMGMTIGWPEIYRELLNIPKERAIATSIAIGYPNPKNPLNAFQRPREPLDSLVEWHGL